MPKSNRFILLMCLVLPSFALLHHTSPFIQNVHFETPLFKNSSGHVISVQNIFENTLRYLDASVNPTSDIWMSAFGHDLHLKLGPSDNQHPITSKWDAIFANGHVYGHGEDGSTVKLSYIPAGKTLRGFFDFKMDPTVFGDPDTQKSMRLFFDQYQDSKSNQTRNVVYKFIDQNIPTVSQNVFRVNLKKRAAPILGHLCKTVVIADASFRTQYGNRAESYIRELYNFSDDLIWKEIGIAMSLDKIVYSNATPGTQPINQYLKTISDTVRANNVDVRLRNGRDACLVHVISFSTFKPALGLAFVAPRPAPVDSRGVSAGPVSVSDGGICGEKGYNMLVTTTKSGTSEIPQKSAVTALQHEFLHTLSAVHRRQCCANVMASLGVTTENMDATRKTWVSNAMTGCKKDQVKQADGTYIRDVMSEEVIIGGAYLGDLGWCVKGMVMRFLSIEKNKMIASGCLVPTA